MTDPRRLLLGFCDPNRLRVLRLPHDGATRVGGFVRVPGAARATAARRLGHRPAGGCCAAAAASACGVRR